jgi:ribosomal protein S18 acetylase RimI-like enzyme
MNELDRAAFLIECRTPSIDEYLNLRKRSGLTPFSRQAAEVGLKGTVFSCVVVKAGAAVGMGRVIGDGGCFFQITDIAVLPEHQGRGLGKRIMATLMEHVQNSLPATAYVSLIADVPANKLYELYGFKETAPRSVGMSYVVRK